MSNSKPQPKITLELTDCRNGTAICVYLASQYGVEHLAVCKNEFGELMFMFADWLAQDAKAQTVARRIATKLAKCKASANVCT